MQSRRYTFIVGLMGSRIQEATESRRVVGNSMEVRVPRERHSPMSGGGIRLRGKPQVKSEAALPVKIVQVYYHNTLLVALVLMLSACGGKPAGTAPVLTTAPTATAPA